MDDRSAQPSVLQLAKRWETGNLLPLLGTNSEEDDLGALSASAVLQHLLQLAKDLRGRAAGRNREDLTSIDQGLRELQRRLDEEVPAECQKAAQEAQQAAQQFLAASAECRQAQEQQQVTHAAQLKLLAAQSSAALAAEQDRADAQLATQRQELQELQERQQQLQAEVQRAATVCSMHEESEVGRLERDVAEQERLLAALQAERQRLAALLGGSELEAAAPPSGMDLGPASGSPDGSSTDVSVPGSLQPQAAAGQQVALQPPLRALQPAPGSVTEWLQAGAPTKSADGVEAARGRQDADGWQLQGRPELGCTLHTRGRSRDAEEFLWYARQHDGAWQLIAGAGSAEYSPEPADVGFRLICQVLSGSQQVILTSEPILGHTGLQEAVGRAAAEGRFECNVRIAHLNGMPQPDHVACRLAVKRDGIVLRAAGWLRMRASYSVHLQVCGARGGGAGAALGLFLAVAPGRAFMLVCDSPALRNGCIAVIRQFASGKGLRQPLTLL